MPAGFIRVKLLQCERGEYSVAAGDTFDPFVAVNVKEAQNTPGMRVWVGMGRGPRMYG